MLHRSCSALSPLLALLPSRPRPQAADHRVSNSSPDSTASKPRSRRGRSHAGNLMHRRAMAANRNA